MRYLVDAQLPPALARWLVVEGHEAEHVIDRRLETASDREIWDFALETEAVIVTKDEDFAVL
jgi:predicted nuclease of predicted toxin-antitoxin system